MLTTCIIGSWRKWILVLIIGAHLRPLYLAHSSVSFFDLALSPTTTSCNTLQYGDESPHCSPIDFYLVIALVQSAYTIPSLPGQFIAQIYGVYDTLYASSSTTWTTPKGFDFWREANLLGDRLRRYAENELASASITYSDVADQIADFKDTMKRVVDAAAQMHDFKSGSDLDKHDISVSFDYNEFYGKLSAKADVIIQQFLEEFKEPLPENQTERYKKTDDAVTWLLDKLEDALVEVYAAFGVSEAEARERFGYLKPHIKYAVLIAAKLAEEHPQIVEVLIVSAVILALPEGAVMRPLIRVFGWGPQGPVKGSTAASLQRYFYRTAIQEGSWFARLQSAGMKWGSRAGCKAVAGAGFAAIMTGVFCGCF